MSEQPFVPPPSPYIVREFNDRGTQWLLEDPLFLRDLVRILDSSLADRLDFIRAERVNRTFIPANLQKRESDLIYKIPYRTGEIEVLVYLLLEQQTQPDRTMPYRILRYTSELWDTQERAWKDQHGDAQSMRLYPVIPIVFYTGEERWSGSMQLAGIMDMPDELHRFVPSWDTLFLNLKETPEEALTQFASALGWALRVLQAEKKPLAEMERVLTEAMAGIEELVPDQSGQWLRCAWFLLQLVFHRRGRTEAPSLMRMVVESARQSKFHEGREEVEMQSYAEYLTEEGEARGEARGEVIGERKLLLRLGSGRLGPPDLMTLTTLEAIQSTEILERLGLRLYQVGSWQELVSDVTDHDRPTDAN